MDDWRKHVETIKVWEYYVAANGRGEPYLELFHTPCWVEVYETVITWKFWFYIPFYYKFWVKNVCRFEHKRKSVGSTPITKELADAIDPDSFYVEREDDV